MFIDPIYECVTMPQVRKEVFQTTRFKHKYPWRINFKTNLKALGTSDIYTDEFSLYYEVIDNLVRSGTLNNITGFEFNLSHVDKEIAACALAHLFSITTTDKDLLAFINQEFSDSSTETISPLGLINASLKNEFIECDSDLIHILEDWDKCGEARQPRRDIEVFEEITEVTYPGH
ncbi:MAG: hypothetical protein WCA08_12150 [Desulfoferrobacter sp.]